MKDRRENLNKYPLRNIYIHLPFCLKKCHYCSFAIHAVGTKSDNQLHFDTLQDQYVRYLQREMEVIFQLSPPSSQLETLYFGGGTPSIMSVASFAALFNSINRRTNIANAECTIECDPGTFNQQKLTNISQLGVNRFSLGVQTFSRELLSSLNRSHTVEQTYQAVSHLEAVCGIERVSMDLLINVPQQTQVQVEESTKRLIAFRPGHCSVYGLQIEPGSYFNDRLGYKESSSSLAYEYIHSELIAAGYDHYEVSNFSLGSHNRSRHNQVYWEGTKDFYGFGMGASSLQNGQRTNRPRTLKKYFEFVEYLEANNSYPAEYVEDERKDSVKMIIMGRIRRKEGFLLSDLRSNEYERKIRQILETPGYSDLIDMPAFRNESRVKMLPPKGYLLCDELVHRFVN